MARKNLRRFVQQVMSQLRDEKKGKAIDMTAGRELAAQLYEEAGVGLDKLAYTDQFQAMFQEWIVSMNDPRWTIKQFWDLLITLRKGGHLPRVKKTKR